MQAQLQKNEHLKHIDFDDEWLSQAADKASLLNSISMLRSSNSDKSFSVVQSQNIKHA